MKTDYQVAPGGGTLSRRSAPPRGSLNGAVEPMALKREPEEEFVPSQRLTVGEKLAGGALALAFVASIGASLMPTPQPDIVTDQAGGFATTIECSPLESLENPTQPYSRPLFFRDGLDQLFSDDPDLTVAERTELECSFAALPDHFLDFGADQGLRFQVFKPGDHIGDMGVLPEADLHPFEGWHPAGPGRPGLADTLELGRRCLERHLPGRPGRGR